MFTSESIFIYPVVCHLQNLDNPYMCYEFRTPLLPPPPWPIHSWFRLPKQSDLSVTSTLPSVNRWRHNEYSCCSHPSFLYRLNTHLLSRSDYRSDLIRQDGQNLASKQHYRNIYCLLWQNKTNYLVNIICILRVCAANIGSHLKILIITVLCNWNVSENVNLFSDLLASVNFAIEYSHSQKWKFSRCKKKFRKTLKKLKVF